MITDAPQGCVPKILRCGELVDAFRSGFVPAQDLFSDLAQCVAEFAAGKDFTPSHGGGGLAAFHVAPHAVVTVDWAMARPPVLQAFLYGLSKFKCDDSFGRTLEPHTIGAAEGLIVWVPLAQLAEMARDLWVSVNSSGELDQLEILSTARLYGNKVKLTSFICSVFSASISPDVPVLDLMTGSGVVARALSRSRPVFVNDGNAYAALFGRSQGLSLGEPSDALLSMLRPMLRRNIDGLRDALSVELEIEASFLHGEVNVESLNRYAEFVRNCEFKSIQHRDDLYRLVTERYANLYFGLNQSIEIDSLRCAIDVVAPEGGVRRDLLLTALLLAMTVCASGPHFAQPNQPNSLNMMQRLIEKRARSVAWEFDLALARLGAREAPKFEIQGGAPHDWRDGFGAFHEKCANSGGAVYVDPPYSKLQYSRYYHVLNEVLAYDYPDVSGAGKYPPLNRRFSSKFEYQPGSARREFEELFRAVSEAGMTIVVSYGDKGFVKIDDIMMMMSCHFDEVYAFHQNIKHHSQGKVFSGGRSEVTEYVLIGR